MMWGKPSSVTMVASSAQTAADVEVCCTSEVCWEFTSIYTTRVYHSLHRSTMGCSLRVTRAG